MSPTQSPDFTAYDRYIDEQFDSMVEELRAFCSTPTLAGQRIGLEEGVAAVGTLLGDIGASIKVVPVGDGAPPVVIAECGSGDRTLLLYNHYDVQPPEPLELWDSPPYAGDIRDGKMYARGVADDRSDFLSRVLAVRAYQATIGDLPLRLRWLVEGEEEISSPNLLPAVTKFADDLKADWCAWEGAGRDDEYVYIVCGVKGMLYVELHATGPNRDAHSGQGGIIPNPAWRLVMALSTMRDAKGNFIMDGLDELVDPPTEGDLRAADAMPFDEETHLALLGLDHWQRGLKGHDVIKAEMFDPTANIAGFHSGYGGEGSKTIVPSKAMVKMDFRLVPRQTPEKMQALLRAHLDARGYTDIEIVHLGSLYPAKTSVDHPLVQESAAAWRDLGEETVVVAPMTGGSGPLSLITEQLGIPTVMTGGTAYEGCQVHSPNENIRLKDFKLAIRYWGRFFSRLANS